MGRKIHQSLIDSYQVWYCINTIQRLLSRDGHLRFTITVVEMKLNLKGLR